jgi:hypothetical protein
MVTAVAPRRETGKDRSDPIDGVRASSGNYDQPTSDVAGEVRRKNVEDSGATNNFLEISRAAEDRDQTFKGAMQRARWQRAISQTQNKHFGDSKYNSKTFNNRSKVFRPKTLSALRKNLASAAAALFSTNDAVVVKAEHDSDPIKNASAAVLQELLHYRLDRTSVKSGLPWFLVCMGAKRQIDTYGVCYSKQYWEYEEVQEDSVDEITEQHVYLDTGEPVLDEETGQPKVSKRYEKNSKKHVTKDRPMVMLFSPDNVVIDPAAPWYDPTQSSAYLGLRYPMTIGDAKVFMSNAGKGKEEWLDIPDALLFQASEEYTSKGVRAARGDGIDRYDDSYRTSPGTGFESNIVWLYEWFMRVKGVDYHFWTVGTIAYASKIRTTRQAYPEQMGDRPVCGGYGSIEPDEIYPMAAVTAWEQMQTELNDLVNLRLDNLKQALSPIAKVKQGATFDFKQLQARSGQDVTIQVKSMDDLEFDRPPDVAGSAYQETALLNNDFDDLSGVFAQSSLQSNRQLNETVGGLRLLSGTANAVTEFDLRVWVETWVEKVVRQLLRLEQMWENDQVVLTVCGNRAKMFERFGINQITDQDLLHEASVKVNVGIGSADPMQKMTKLASAFQMLSGMAPFFSKKVMIKPEEVIKEVMGPAGYNDGLRFFEITEIDPSQQGGGDKGKPAGKSPEELQMVQAQHEQDGQIEMAIAQLKQSAQQNTERTKMLIAMLQEHAETQRASAESDSRERIAHMNALTKAHASHVSARAAERIAAEKAKREQRSARVAA